MIGDSLLVLGLLLLGNGHQALNIAEDGEGESNKVHDNKGLVVLVELEKGFVVEGDLLHPHLRLIRSGQEVDHVHKEEGQQEIKQIDGMADEGGLLGEEPNESWGFQKKQQQKTKQKQMKRSRSKIPQRVRQISKRRREG